MSELHQIMPHSAQSEQAVLASLFYLNAEQRSELTLRSDLFWMDNHKAVFEAICSADIDGIGIDPITITEQMKKDGTIGRLGIFESNGTFIAMLVGSFVTHGNLKNYIQILEEMFKRRELIVSATKAVNDAQSLDVSIEETIARTQSRIAIVTEEKDNQCITGKAFGEVERQITERRTMKKSYGMVTGVPAWDSAMKGIFPGDMQLIGARPAVGKTAAMETAIQTQIEIGIPVLCFQRDTAVSTMLGRMACRRARVVYEEYIYGKATPGMLDRVSKALKYLKSKSDCLRIYNPVRLTASDLHSIVLREIKKHGIKVWYLDHFQTLEYGNEFIAAGLTNASISIRRTINATGIPGVIIAQVSKDADKTGIPNSSQFKWCDQLFSDADKIALMYSDEDPKLLAPDKRQTVKWIVDKHRGGAVTNSEMLFHRELMTFESAY